MGSQVLLSLVLVLVVAVNFFGQPFLSVLARTSHNTHSSILISSGHLTSMSDFVQSLLIAHLRGEAAQAAIKVKLRGRRLLLERAASLSPAISRQERNVTPGQTCSIIASNRVPRRARRSTLLAAANKVTFEQLSRQHDTWMAYAAAALSTCREASEVANVMQHIDWHAAQARVIASSSDCHSNASGLILAETKRMLLVATNTRRVWIPKKGTTLEIKLPHQRAVGGLAEFFPCDAAKHAY